MTHYFLFCFYSSDGWSHHTQQQQQQQYHHHQQQYHVPSASQASSSGSSMPSTWEEEQAEEHLDHNDYSYHQDADRDTGVSDCSIHTEHDEHGASPMSRHRQSHSSCVAGLARAHANAARLHDEPPYESSYAYTRMPTAKTTKTTKVEVEDPWTTIFLLTTQLLVTSAEVSESLATLTS